VELKRTLNLLDASAIGVGAIIGAGIFVVLGIAVGYAGPAVIVSMIIAGTVALFTALSARGTRMGAGADLSNQNPKT
jgi:APA family basic amino acid/polyamine antiporter